MPIVSTENLKSSSKVWNFGRDLFEQQFITAGLKGWSVTVQGVSPVKRRDRGNRRSERPVCIGRILSFGFVSIQYIPAFQAFEVQSLTVSTGLAACAFTCRTFGPFIGLKHDQTITLTDRHGPTNSLRPRRSTILCTFCRSHRARHKTDCFSLFPRNRQSG